jgi:hypothetical protein
LEFIGTHRTNSNRLGIAVQLCFLRHPGRAWTLEERIPATMNDRNGVYLSVLMGFVAINVACNLPNLPFKKAFKLSAASTEFYVCPE